MAGVMPEGWEKLVEEEFWEGNSFRDEGLGIVGLRGRRSGVVGEGSRDGIYGFKDRGRWKETEGEKKRFGRWHLRKEGYVRLRKFEITPFTCKTCSSWQARTWVLTF